MAVSVLVVEDDRNIAELLQMLRSSSTTKTETAIRYTSYFHKFPFLSL